MIHKSLFRENDFSLSVQSYSTYYIVINAKYDPCAQDNAEF